MLINVLDLIDFKRVDALLEGFHKSTGVLTAILDLEGNILSKSGWRKICTHFHRVNPETSRNCTVSDTVLAGQMAAGEKYHFYQCLNGMVDVAVPLMIKGEHVANLFSGQFFFEEPDRAFFKTQAVKFGFDEDSYLNALASVPVVSKENVKTAMDFLLAMTQLISDMALQKLEQLELNAAIQKSEERFRTFMDETPVYAYIKDGSLNHVFRNKRVEALIHPNQTGQRVESAQTIFTSEVADQLERADREILSGRTNRSELEFRFAINGEDRWFHDIKFAFPLADGSRAVGGVAFDITERKRTEARLIEQLDELRRWQELTLGRESRILSMKKEVNDLLAAQGQPPRYPSARDDEVGK